MGQRDLSAGKGIRSHSLQHIRRIWEIWEVSSWLLREGRAAELTQTSSMSSTPTSVQPSPKRKSSFFQSPDRTHTHREYQPFWELNDRHSKCQRCQRSFGVARRKHHCRACGYVCCNRCTSYRKQLVGSNHLQRWAQKNQFDNWITWAMADCFSIVISLFMTSRFTTLSLSKIISHMRQNM